MFVLLEKDLLVGFYKFVHHRCYGTAELVDLYLDLPSIGGGLGQCLWDDFVERARCMDCTSITIESNPHAEGFYKKQGACRIGEVCSVDLHIELRVNCNVISSRSTFISISRYSSPATRHRMADLTTATFTQHSPA